MVLRIATLSLIVLAAFVWACLGPQIQDGSLACDQSGLCPDGFECAADGRCYRYAGVCGDSVIDPGESCDPSTLCPTGCSDGNSCTQDDDLGTVRDCTFRCVRSLVANCDSGDGCCPNGCNAGTDADCVSTCNNGTFDPGETCDDSAGVSCEITCSDGDACTNDVTVGQPSNCNVACAFTDIVVCQGGDGCCPVGCNAATDSDCSATCGDGNQDPGEFCDPPVSCPRPSDCVDNNACTYDNHVGSPFNCTARCVHTPITSCNAAVSDGCCPGICTPVNDLDCVPPSTCGDGQFDPSIETCDDSGGAPCPTSCDAASDEDPCKIYQLVGNALTCDAECASTPVTQCTGGDQCCPPGCVGTGGAFTDSDCLQAMDGGITIGDGGI